MSRTELITLLRILGPTANYDAHNAMDAAADMLEADELMRLANIDCVNHFNAIKEDYDKLQAAARLALDALIAMQSYAAIDEAIAALKDAL